MTFPYTLKEISIGEPISQHTYLYLAIIFIVNQETLGSLSSLSRTIGPSYTSIQEKHSSHQTIASNPTPVEQIIGTHRIWNTSSMTPIAD